MTPTGFIGAEVWQYGGLFAKRGGESGGDRPRAVAVVRAGRCRKRHLRWIVFFRLSESQPEAI